MSFLTLFHGPVGIDGPLEESSSLLEQKPLERLLEHNANCEQGKTFDSVVLKVVPLQFMGGGGRDM